MRRGCNHGFGLYCNQCSLPYEGTRPLIPSAYASPIETGPLPATAIDEAFSKARETVSRLESQNSIATLWRPSDSF